MKNKQSVTTFFIIIGLIGVAFSVYMALIGAELDEYLAGLISGVTFLGAAYWNSRQGKKEDNNQ